jgi:hypothetical protein
MPAYTSWPNSLYLFVLLIKPFGEVRILAAHGPTSTQSSQELALAALLPRPTSTLMVVLKS